MGTSFTEVLGLDDLDLILFRVATNEFPYNRKCQLT